MNGSSSAVRTTLKSPDHRLWKGISYPQGCACVRELDPPSWHSLAKRAGHIALDSSDVMRVPLDRNIASSSGIVASTSTALAEHFHTTINFGYLYSTNAAKMTRRTTIVNATVMATGPAGCCHLSRSTLPSRIACRRDSY